MPTDWKQGESLELLLGHMHSEGGDDKVQRNYQYSGQMLKQLSFLNKTDQSDNLTMEAYWWIRKRREILKKIP